MYLNIMETPFVQIYILSRSILNFLGYISGLNVLRIHNHDQNELLTVFISSNKTM